MSPEDQKMFDRYFDMFASEGWKQFTSDLESNLAAVSSIKGIPDAATLHKNQGKVEVLENVLSLPNYVEALYQQMTEEQDNTDEAI